MHTTSETVDLNQRRQMAMHALAHARIADVQRLVAEAGLTVEAHMLRGPEIGLVTVRGRIGGGGAPFNTGEATVTRATVKLPTGEIGHAYQLGRDLEKARLSAVLDALMQYDDVRPTVEARIIEPLALMQRHEADQKRSETAATKVDFFTMVRGED